MHLKIPFSILFIYFLSSNYIFAQKRPPAKTYHREELVEKIMQNTDFQAYYAEMQLVTNLYQKVILGLDGQAFEKVDKSYEEGGYYYTKPTLIFTDTSNRSLVYEELAAFAKKTAKDIERNAERNMDSLREIISKQHPDTLRKRIKQHDEMEKKQADEKYRKHEIFMQNYLKISPDAVNAHFEKATQHLIKLFDAFAQLKSTSYGYDNFSYVMKKSIELYAQKKEKSKKDACLQKIQEPINSTISMYAGDIHFSYLYSHKGMDTLEKKYFTMTHTWLITHCTNYRKCIDAQKKK